MPEPIWCFQKNCRDVGAIAAWVRGVAGEEAGEVGKSPNKEGFVAWLKSLDFILQSVLSH